MSRNDSSWLKDNLFVVAALALPLIVIGFFLAATGIPRFLVDDPQYDALYVVEQYLNEEYAMRFRVVDGRLRADVRLNSSAVHWPNQMLFRFDASTQKTRRIDPIVPESVKQSLHSKVANRSAPASPLVAPEPAPADTSETFDVAETASLRVLPDATAPDGYEFRNEFTGNRGLFGELFGMGSRRSGISVARKGRVIPLMTPNEDQYRYYNNGRLLGWIAQ